MSNYGMARKSCRRQLNHDEANNIWYLSTTEIFYTLNITGTSIYQIIHVILSFSADLFFFFLSH